MDKEQLAAQIEERINKEPNIDDIQVIVLRDETIETADYFVFFYQSKRYMETGNYSYFLVGNAPIIVDKITREKYITGTAHDIEFYIEEYKNGLLGKW
ncbi:MAG: YrhB domain-containing protein [Bacteroidota bacterium]